MMPGNNSPIYGRIKDFRKIEIYATGSFKYEEINTDDFYVEIKMLKSRK